MKMLRPFTIALMLLLTACMSVNAVPTHGPDDDEKAKNKLRKTIVTMIQEIGYPDSPDLNGQAVLTFYLNADSQIAVKGVYGTNMALLDHIRYTLDGAFIEATDKQLGKEYTLKIKFEDLR